MQAANPVFCKWWKAPGSKLYGRTIYGGLWDWGTLFEFDYVTREYRLLHSFGHEDGGLSTNAAC